MRWFTCTPVAFGGGADFFARDSGLLCRGFQALGVESRAVMPGPAMEGDEADLIRTDFANLESAEWWKSHELDGVVLYAWGSPRFRKVAEAIRDAGFFLILNQDNGGLISPWAGFTGWFAEQRIMSDTGVAFTKLLARGLVGMALTDPPRAAHLKAGSIIACVSPAAVEHYKKLCRHYGGEGLVKRVKLLPHPVEPSFDFTKATTTKLRQIACVGRWQDELQKRPGLMQIVIRQLMESDGNVTVQIAGATTDSLTKWHQLLPADQRRRIQLRGILDRAELATMLAESQIFYSPSAFESFGIAAGEALCSGCSVVAGKSPSMGSFQWFVSEKSGRLALSDDANGHLEALRKELGSWDSGSRNPALIATNWGTSLHADKVAARAIKFHEAARSS